MQLRSMFHKTANKNELKVLKIESHKLSSFLVIGKTVIGVWGSVGQGSKFFLFLS